MILRRLRQRKNIYRQSTMQLLITPKLARALDKAIELNNKQQKQNETEK